MVIVARGDEPDAHARGLNWFNVDWRFYLVCLHFQDRCGIGRRGEIRGQSTEVGGGGGRLEVRVGKGGDRRSE